MPMIKIDDREIEVAAGTTVLDAATTLGIEIPTLCYLKGYSPSTSCQVCLVRDVGSGKLMPSCATKVVDGMRLESESDFVHDARRTALELLLSDHVGDCLAPCHFACPAHMDIPLMLRDIGDGDLKHAIATIKRDIALPAVLGRICTKPCEKGCRRRDADGPVAVCELKRIAADQDLKQQHPFAPECLPDSGKRVAIIGAGPCGLSAAYYLRQRGHHCLLTERESLAGGRMRTETNEDVLPREVLDAEINQILRLGIELKTDGAVTTQEEFDRLCKGHDALLVACGAASADQTETWGLKGSRKGVYTDRETYRTGRTGVFAAGCAVRGKALFVRSAADGKEVAQCIDQFLSGQEMQGPTKPFSSRMGKIDTDELNQFVSLADAGATDHPSGDGRDQSDQANEQTSEQADRCLACGCVAHGHCQLERYASQYQADPNRFGPRHRSFEIMGREGNVLFEPGKCIKCELCIQIAAASGNALGLSFVGRGFDVRVGVPFHESFDAGVAEVAAECIAACPTGAIYFNHRRQQIHSLDEASN